MNGLLTLNEACPEDGERDSDGATLDSQDLVRQDHNTHARHRQCDYITHSARCQLRI